MSLLKEPPIRLKKITQSARGQDCTAHLPCCNHNPETTVFAHYGEPGERGMSFKPDDTSGGYLCSDCHDVMDGRVPQTFMLRSEMQRMWFKVCRRTWRLLVLNGVLK
jgi:hypothetical protein